MSVGVGKNRLDQLVEVYGWFLNFVRKTLKENQLDTQNVDRLQKLLGSVPTLVICAQAEDMMGRLTDEKIKNQDMKTVFVLISELSDGSSADDIAEDAVQFCHLLEKDPKKKTLFFKYLDTIKKILTV